MSVQPFRLWGRVPFQLATWFWLPHRDTGESGDPPPSTQKSSWMAVTNCPQILGVSVLPVYTLAGVCVRQGDMSSCQLPSEGQDSAQRLEGTPFQIDSALALLSSPCPGPSTHCPFPAWSKQNINQRRRRLQCCQSISSLRLFFLPECFTANGADYRGAQNWTALRGGEPCLYWNETLQHPYNTLRYPNGEGGLGSHNYCR